jgi:restriction endonuclease S subunit
MDTTITSKHWREFEIGNLFTLSQGKSKGLNHLTKLKSGINYLGATNSNNGVLCQVMKVDSQVHKGNCIAFIRNGEGSMGFSVYKAEDFIATSDMSIGYSSFLNRYTGNFITTIADMIRGKYNFGYKRSDSRLRKEKIMLPIDQSGRPDYAFMEAYMKQKEQEKLAKYKAFVIKRLVELQGYEDTGNVSDRQWGEFFIQDIASIESGRDIYEKERVEGGTPYASATSNNNGIGYFIDNDNETKESGCLSVNRNGSVGYCFYHTYPTLFSNDCRKLRLKNNSRFIGIFISQQITKQKGKYGYGYKMGTARLRKQKIMLPIDQSGKPDYAFMENYMKRLEYQKLKKYAAFKGFDV